MRLLIIIILIGAGVMGFYMYQNNLNPLNPADLSKAKEGILSKGNKITEVVTQPDQTPKQTIVYKRKDKNGNWYYSNEPPKKGEQAEATIYSSDTNVIPPLPDDKRKK